MAASNLTTVAYIYKRLYSDKQVGDLAMRDHPLYKMIRKEDGFVGDGFYYPIRYGNPQGISNLFPDAQSGASESKGVQLRALRTKKYGVITLDGEAMLAARGDKGAFLTLVTQETDGVIEEMGDRMAFDLYRDTSGARARLSTSAGIAPGVNDVVNLLVPDDARNFKVGMTIIADDTASGASPRAGSTRIVAVDEDAGTITLADSSAITGLANSDYLFAKGENNNAIEGLLSHLPVLAPDLTDTFRGLTAPGRGADPRRLAGVRVDDTATSIEENAGLVCVKIGQVGKQGKKKLFLNPVNFWQVVRRLGAKVQYDGGGDKALAGFESVDLHTPAGTAKMVSDPDCPTNVGYVLDLSTWYLKHLGGLPHIVQDDGRPSLRATAEDSIEARARAFWNSICTEPGANGRFTI